MAMVLQKQIMYCVSWCPLPHTCSKYNTLYGNNKRQASVKSFDYKSEKQFDALRFSPLSRGN